MKEYTLILVRYNPTGDYLFCHRVKDPWKGLYNFVGGKLEKGETPKECAIRELKEETNIAVEPCNIHLINKLVYYCDDGLIYNDDSTVLWVYATEIDDAYNIKQEKNPLAWFCLEYCELLHKDFAGDGNVGMLIKYYERIRSTGKFCEEPETAS